MEGSRHECCNIINQWQPAKLFQNLLLLIFFCAQLSGCTTQDFEYAGKSKVVYRVKLKNIGNADAVYTPEVSLYYIDGKDSLNFPDKLTIKPEDPEKLIVESKEGAYGISVDIFMINHASEIRLTVEKGTGKGRNFMLDNVVGVKVGKYTQSIRYGKYY